MAQYELNLRDYVRIFRKRKAVIIISFVLVSAGGIFFSRSGSPTYQAVTTVKIEERKTIAGLLTEWIVYNPADTMESQTKLIHGYELMRKAALHLGMINATSSEAEVNAAINSVSGKIDTERVGNTNIIRIIATSDNSQEVIELANTVAEVYIEENLLEKTRQARGSRQFIEEQLASLENRLKEKEEGLRKFQEELKNINLVEQMQKKIAELEFQLTDLLQKYTDKHPQVMQIKEQISELEKQSKNFSGEELKYGQIVREIEADKKLYSMLKEKLEEARISEAQKVGDVSIVNPAVTTSVTLPPNKSFGILISGTMGIILGFALALILENLDMSIAKIEDVEGMLKVPVLGIIPTISMESEVITQKGIISKLKRKFLHEPRTEIEERYIHLVMHYNSTAPAAEAYRNINTNLKLDSTKKTILITSAGPREGKTTILTNLGLALAQGGSKVLLVSSDIRRPAIAKTFGIKREPGLTEVLLGTIKLEEAVKNITDIMLGEISFDEIQQTPGLDNVWILTSGQLPFNPAKVLESKELSYLIEEVKKQYDVILFDSPPVLPVTDASLLAPKMDCVIIVYEIGRTSRDALLRTKSQLDSVGAKIRGIILNQTRQDIAADLIYPYYYKYRYYREEKEASKKEKKPVKV